MRRGRGLAVAVAAAVLLGSAPALALPVQPQVVNGRDPEPGEVRALVSVYAAGLSCGGTLVDALHVVTAAHCVVNLQGVTAQPSQVRVGWSSTTTRAAPTLPVARVAAHPEYDASTFSYDVAVIELLAPIPGATPMLVASAARSAAALAPGSPVRAAGFGRTSVDGPLSNRTLVADLTVVPDNVCARQKVPYRIGNVDFYGYGKEFDPASSACAIGVVPGTTLIIDTCQGDSGGPLYSGSGVGGRLLGVVSNGDGCAGFIEPGREKTKKRPGVYAKTSAVLPWLAAEGVDMSDESLAPPVITSATPEAGAVSVTVAAGSGTRLDTVTISATNASTSVVDGSCVAPVPAGTGGCRISGLTAGSTYALTAVAATGDLVSAPSAAVTVTLPGKPPTPRIREIYSLGGGRVEFIVVAGASASAPVDRTTVSCTPRGPAKAGAATVTGALTAGTVELALVRGQRYTCRAVSTNDLGASRSRPEYLQL